MTPKSATSRFRDTEALRSYYRDGGDESLPERQRSYLRKLAEMDVTLSANGDWTLIQHGRGNWQVVPAGTALMLRADQVDVGSVGSKTAAVKLAAWLSDNVRVVDGTAVDWSSPSVYHVVESLRAFGNEQELALIAARARFDELTNEKFSHAGDVFKRIGRLSSREDLPEGQKYADELRSGDALVTRGNKLVRIAQVEERAGYYFVTTGAGERTQFSRNAPVPAVNAADLVVCDNDGQRIGEWVSDNELKAGDEITFVISGERIDPMNRYGWRKYARIDVLDVWLPERVVRLDSLERPTAKLKVTTEREVQSAVTPAQRPSAARESVGEIQRTLF